MDRTAAMGSDTANGAANEQGLPTLPPPGAIPDVPQPTLPDLPPPFASGVPLPTLPSGVPLPTLPPTDAGAAAGAVSAWEPALVGAPLPSPFSAGARHTPLGAPPPRLDPRAGAAYGSLPGKPRAGEPSAAAVRASEQRRRAKQRRRVRRIAAVVVAIAVSVLAGPPVVRWITNELERAAPDELPVDQAPESPTASD